MHKSIKTILTILTVTSVILFGSSCQRTASCPAYHSVDPSKAALNMSKEKFMNPDLKEKTPEDNKKDVEKRKNAELNKRYNRKKAHNLFPAYMR